jgi:Arc/MetJ-type ribon-helix-helix transcriptional regulator/predicted RNA-binding Zn-ribbon protein involved in translation (DUF1610 family)
MGMTTGMSKITFRADDELIEQLEEFDASKSEIMREALRAYLEEHATQSSFTDGIDQQNESLDELVADRIDELVADRLEQSYTPSRPQDVNVNITLDGGLAEASDESPAGVNVSSGVSHDASNDSSHTEPPSKTDEGVDENTPGDERNTCTQCGETLSPSHVYCPNCGEKSAHRVFCECGDEIRSDWAFCPSCGRRTPAADVLDDTKTP